MIKEKLLHFLLILSHWNYTNIVLHAKWVSEHIKNSTRSCMHARAHTQCSFVCGGVCTHVPTHAHICVGVCVYMWNKHVYTSLSCNSFTLNWIILIVTGLRIKSLLLSFSSPFLFSKIQSWNLSLGMQEWSLCKPYSLPQAHNPNH